MRGFRLNFLYDLIRIRPHSITQNNAVILKHINVFFRCHTCSYGYVTSHIIRKIKCLGNEKKNSFSLPFFTKHAAQSFRSNLIRPVQLSWPLKIPQTSCLNSKINDFCGNWNQANPDLKPQSQRTWSVVGGQFKTRPLRGYRIQNNSLLQLCVRICLQEQRRATEIKATNPADPAPAPLILRGQTHVTPKDLHFPQSTSEKSSHLSQSHHSIITDAHSHDNMGL